MAAQASPWILLPIPALEFTGVEDWFVVEIEDVMLHAAFGS
jgi:hypothetical protein